MSEVALQADRIDVFPPHGFLRLVNWMGSELDIVNAARVSFHKESDEFLDSDKGLIRFLLANRHGSPFEQGFQSMWHVRLPIFVMREWGRHRIGHSVNEESGRYVEMRPDFYYPEYWRRQTGKPGAYKFKEIPDEPFLLNDYSTHEHLRNLVEDASMAAWLKYQQLLKLGVAKEQARIVLPLNLYTEIRWTANARSLMHFLGLRNAPDAMFEIKQYAWALEHFFAEHMPNVHDAFVTNGRVAP